MSKDCIFLTSCIGTSVIKDHYKIGLADNTERLETRMFQIHFRLKKINANKHIFQGQGVLEKRTKKKKKNQHIAVCSLKWLG